MSQTVKTCTTAVGGLVVPVLVPVPVEDVDVETTSPMVNGALVAKTFVMFLKWLLVFRLTTST